MSNHKYVLYKILSYLPMFRVTDDKNFGEVTKESKQIRISLLSFNLGSIIIHFLTKVFDNDTFVNKSEIVSDKGDMYCFRVFYITKFPSLPDKKNVEEKIENFKEFLIDKNEKKRRAYEESLRYRIEQEDNIISKSFNKFLAYIAIIAFVIPLLAPYLLTFYSLFNKSYIEFYYYIICYMALLYCFLNLILLLQSFIKVKGSYRFTIRDIKESSNPSKALICGFYNDWFWKKEERLLEVSIVKNIEKYIKLLIVWIFLLVIIHNFIQYFNHSALTTKAIPNLSQEAVYLDISLDTTEFFKRNNKFISQLQDDLLNQRIETIILIKSSESKNVEENYNRLIYLIKAFNISNIDLIEIKEREGKQLDDKEVHFITIRREK